MPATYNRLAGQQIERIAALSDGVFAIAMTLIVLDIKTPPHASVHSEAELWAALVELAPRLLMYLMSVMTLGIFWVGQQTQFNHLARSDRNYTWINFAFLAAICMLPFSTALLAEFIAYRVALVIYWLNILVPGLLLLAAWTYACRIKLFSGEVSPEIEAALTRRIVIAQCLYAAGMALCVFSTTWSIAFIVLVQLNYALAPRIGILGRI